MNTWIRKTVWPLMGVPAIWLALVWNRLPEQVALHFDMAGRPDRWGSKRELIAVTVLLTVLNAGIYLLLTNIYRIDPKQKAAENKDRLLKMAYAIVVFMTLIQCLVMYSSQAGSFRMTASLILAATGFLFAVIGNYMPNLRPNYFAGMRLPWTLESEDNWRRTHALMGKLWFAGGLLIAVLCLLVPPAWAFPLFFGIMILITGIPALYSYRLFRATQKAKTNSHE
jgi:uncharacterized membrane protein